MNSKKQEELEFALRQRDEKIRAKDKLIDQLQEEVTRRDEKIMELLSQLDKYKSVFNQNCSQPNPKKRGRGVGISAEPQPWVTAADLNRDFKRHPKNNRWVSENGWVGEPVKHDPANFRER